MATYRILCVLLSSWSIILCRQVASAFLTTTTTTSPTTTRSNVRSAVSIQRPNTASWVLHVGGFEQRPGESTTDFIKRVTSQSNELLEKQKNGQSLNTNNNSTDSDESPKPRGKYQRIEEWDAERKANGKLAWEQKVQFDGQRYGNQVKQNDILLRHLGM